MSSRGKRKADTGGPIEVEEVTRYRVLSEYFGQRWEAELYRRSLMHIEEANRLWESGRTLDEIAKRYPLVFDRSTGRHVLDGIGDVHSIGFLTMAHTFQIEHWQCSEEYAYRPLRFEANPRRVGWTLFVHGKPGRAYARWFGRRVSIEEAARYPARLIGARRGAK